MFRLCGSCFRLDAGQSETATPGVAFQAWQDSDFGAGIATARSQILGSEAVCQRFLCRWQLLALLICVAQVLPKGHLFVVVSQGLRQWTTSLLPRSNFGKGGGLLSDPKRKSSFTFFHSVLNLFVAFDTFEGLNVKATQMFCTCLILTNVLHVAEYSISCSRICSILCSTTECSFSYPCQEIGCTHPRIAALPVAFALRLSQTKVSWMTIEGPRTSTDIVRTCMNSWIETTRSRQYKVDAFAPGEESTCPSLWLPELCWMVRWYVFFWLGWMVWANLGSVCWLESIGGSMI